MDGKIRWVDLLWALIFLAVITLYFLGCAHDPKRERIQRDYPECEVTEDYEVKCPSIFDHLTHP